MIDKVSVGCLVYLIVVFERLQNQTLKLDKGFTQADKIISQSKKYNNGDKHFIEMEDKIKNLKLNNLQKLNLHFALAKAYEDIGDIKNSFENLINQITENIIINLLSLINDN